MSPLRTGSFAAIAAAVLLALPTPGRAADEKPAGVTDLVPEDAAFALMIRNIAELSERGDKFIEASNLRMGEGDRPSRLFSNVFEYFGVKKGVQLKAAAVIVVPNLKALGIEAPKQPDLRYLLTVLQNTVIIAPYDDLDEMAGNFGLKAADLKPGAIKAAKDSPNIGNVVVTAKGKHVYVCQTEKALKAVVDGKPLGGALAPVQRDALAKADFSILFGPKAGGTLWSLLLNSFKDKLIPRDAKGQEKETVDTVFDALGEVRFFVLALRFDDGLAADMIASFPGANDGGAKSAKFLDALRAGPGTSELNGLPRVTPIIAYGAKGDGVRNVQMARALVKLILNHGLGIEVVWSEEERKKFYADFDVMYEHLKGSRLVFYRTPAADAEKVGSVAAVTILDLDDTDAHLARWASLVDLANSLNVKLAKENRKTAPKFAYKAKAETIDGLRVDHLSVEIPELPAEVKKEYEKTFGPDWNKIRLAVQGKQVVALLGSDVTRLKETLNNLKTGNKGLADDKAVTATLARLAPERKIEVHMNLAEFQAFLDGAKPAGKSLSSFALTIEPERLQLEVRVPPADLKALVKALGMAKD